MKTILLAVLLVFTGCLSADEAPLASINNRNFEVEVFPLGSPTATELDILLLPSSGIPSNPTADDCLRIRDTTTITANGTQGELVTPGHFSEGTLGEANECQSPQFRIPLSGTSTLDVVIDDGTGQIHLGLAPDASGHYNVTQCDGAVCI